MVSSLVLRIKFNVKYSLVIWMPMLDWCYFSQGERRRSWIWPSSWTRGFRSSSLVEDKVASWTTSSLFPFQSVCINCAYATVMLSLWVVCSSKHRAWMWDVEQQIYVVKHLCFRMWNKRNKRIPIVIRTRWHCCQPSVLYSCIPGYAEFLICQ